MDETRLITLYHNPRCSKSRAALEIAQQYAARHQLDLKVVEYLKTPLDSRELTELQKQLGEQAAQMVREQDGLDPEQQRNVLLAQPELLQRPIISYNGRAVIGRPTELIQTLLT